MSVNQPTINQDRALETFLALVRIDSPSGGEAAIAHELLERLRRTGIAAEQDQAGNVIGRRDGRGRLAGAAPLLLSAHMDTVQPGLGIQPRIAGGVIASDGSTILGADDKAGMTAVLEALQRAEELGLDCRPVEIAFTVQEETGLAGAKRLDLASFAARQALVLDSNGPLGTLITRAPAHNTIHVVIHGKASHAGLAPENGINAIQVAARALASMRLGRIDAETTSNVGVITGGTATNVVPDRVEVKGEARSRNEQKLETQTRHMVESFETAAAEAGARAEVRVEREYSAINLDAGAPVVRLLSDALRACGLEPHLEATGGGSDANVFNAAGIDAANVGLGFQNPHSVEEHIALADLHKACEVVLAALTS
ncbi:MAG: M20/M25/M40 family metallo-hydrolase [Chloroflexi bacterium]|nr:M20/M25/M40 family metallo-hydrolase [Chloroflexota bacterium]